MNFELFVAVLGTIIVPLQIATFAYVVSIERRLTRLETWRELQGPGPRGEDLAHGVK